MKKAHWFFIFLLAILSTAFFFNKKSKIAIQPFQGFDRALTDTIARKIKANYGAEVYILPEVKLPKEAFVQTKVPRYRADSLLLFLKRNKPASADHVIGLTSQDISVTKRDADGHIKKPEATYSDWGVFGLGYMPGSSCIVSSYRLKHPDKSVFIARLKKVAVHELGHNFGLPHCTTKGCVMQDAVETIKTIDAANDYLCDHCKEKID